MTMKTSQPKAKRVRVMFVLATLILLVGAGGAFVAWATGPDIDSIKVEISDKLNVGTQDSVSVAWPQHGAAAMAVGDGITAASSPEALPMASISKLITALMILEARPLSSGDQGQSFEFTYDDENDYFEALRMEMSALPVPVGGTLTQRQLLEGILIGSACNYANYLVSDIWGSNEGFITAVDSFLQRHGLSEITMVEPTGIDPRNTATPAALIQVGRLALTNPVIAEIVSKQSIELPGVGIVENTNDLLTDPGVVGLKTGTLEGYNLLSAKDITAPDGVTVRVFVVVMNQSSDDERFSSSRDLYNQLPQL